MWFHHERDVTHVTFNMLYVESLFREANNNCVLFHPIKCFNILMKILYPCGTSIHLVTKIYNMKSTQWVPGDENLSCFWLAMFAPSKACFFILIYWRIFVKLLFTQIIIIILIKVANVFQLSLHSILILSLSQRSVHLHTFELPIFCHFC